MTEWRVVRDFPNYVISSEGRVFNRTTAREIFQDKRGERRTVRLYDLDYREHLSVELLVERVFGEDPENLEDPTIRVVVSDHGAMFRNAKSAVGYSGLSQGMVESMLKGKNTSRGVFLHYKHLHPERVVDNTALVGL